MIENQQPNGLDRPGKVQLGKFGDIKRMMRHLSKRENFVDLELVCQDGSLFCHKFIIGAQSRFLRQIMLMVDNDDQLCRILIPDVPKANMEIVLKFLYTGRLAITASVKNIVRELLEKVLRVDARINLPDSVSDVQRKNSIDRDQNGDSGGGAGQNGSKSVDKKSSPNKENSANSEAKDKTKSNCNVESPAKQASNNYPSEVPLSPPHILDEEHFSNANPFGSTNTSQPCGFGTPNRPVTNPDEDSYSNQFVYSNLLGTNNFEYPNQTVNEDVGVTNQNNQDKLVYEGSGNQIGRDEPVSQSENTFLASEVVDLSDNEEPLPEQDLSIENQDEKVPEVDATQTIIAKAPSIVAKSTGGHFPLKRGRGKRNNTAARHDRPKRVKSQNHYESYAMPGGATVTFGHHLNSKDFSSEQQEADSTIKQNPGGINTEEGLRFLPLLPPIPTPPEPNMIISRGKWTKTMSRSQSSRATSSNKGSIRKHHYSPYTITGIMKSSTLSTLEEPEGQHRCQQCPAIYNKKASLDKHVGRAHNPNLRFKCPECPKLVSCKNAIKKHLLSHRPETEWPFECFICFKRFQAKGDLPKHFFTLQHRNDPRIPEYGSEEWINVLNQSCVIPEMWFQRPRMQRISNPNENSIELNVDLPDDGTSSQPQGCSSKDSSEIIEEIHPDESVSQDMVPPSTGQNRDVQIEENNSTDLMGTQKEDTGNQSLKTTEKIDPEVVSTRPYISPQEALAAVAAVSTRFDIDSLLTPDPVQVEMDQNCDL